MRAAEHSRSGVIILDGTLVSNEGVPLLSVQARVSAADETRVARIELDEVVSEMENSARLGNTATIDFSVCNR